MSETQPTINPALSYMNNELDALCKLIREEKVILWVGSGFSSYAGYPTGTQLPSIMLSSLGELPDGAPNPGSASLQEAADYYVEQKERSGLNSFLVEQYGKEPSRCDSHESLALINRVKYVVTTNYDPLFERAYGDKIVVISRDEHLPGSTEYPDKTILLKIHGDITQPDTIVITSEDYRKFDSDTIVWNKIRTLLAEYSVVFIGYSLHDPNVEKMLGDIYARLKGKKHPYFFINWKIDDAKRKDLASYDLHFIEMDAASAIGYITGNAIQYAYLDGMKNPMLLEKSDQIFQSQGFRVDRTLVGGKITHVSLIPIQPGVSHTFTLSLSSKPGAGIEVQAFNDLISGKSFEPVKLTEAATRIAIRNAKINGVFTLDPALPDLKELSITPHPSEMDIVDLQLQNQKIRLANLPMKIYKSETLAKLEIQDRDFTFTLTANLVTHENTVNFSGHTLLPDIERAREIYALFNGWLRGDTIELLSNKFSRPLQIPSSPIAEGTTDNPQMQDLLQFYTDLSDIQKISRVKLHVPDSITSEDLETIQDIVALLRGKKQKIPEISGRIRLRTDDLSPIIDSDSVTLEGSGPMNVFTLFGKTIQVPIKFEGFHMMFKDADKILRLARQGIREMKIVMKSKTGELYLFFQPQLMENPKSEKEAS